MSWAMFTNRSYVAGACVVALVAGAAMGWLLSRPVPSAVSGDNACRGSKGADSGLDEQKRRLRADLDDIRKRIAELEAASAAAEEDGADEFEDRELMAKMGERATRQLMSALATLGTDASKATIAQIRDLAPDWLKWMDRNFKKDHEKRLNSLSDAIKAIRSVNTSAISDTMQLHDFSQYVDALSFVFENESEVKSPCDDSLPDDMTVSDLLWREGYLNLGARDRNIDQSYGSDSEKSVYSGAPIIDRCLNGQGGNVGHRLKNNLAAEYGLSAEMVKSLEAEMRRVELAIPGTQVWRWNAFDLIERMSSDNARASAGRK